MQTNKSDMYRIDIAHFINPYLIWGCAELSNTFDSFVFEQLGLYGLLPCETVINAMGDGLETQKVTSWQPAVYNLMKKVLSSADSIYFIPTHLDRTYSLFDNKLHKYGEIIYQTADGKLKKLSKYLQKQGFAMYDVCLFHQELNAGNLGTNLNVVTEAGVVGILAEFCHETDRPRKYLRILKNQTVVFRERSNMQNMFETALTVNNLNRHTELQDALEEKFKDLELCKDVDEESFGRGSSRKADELSDPMLVKKLSLRKTKKSETEEALMATKVFLRANGKHVENRPIDVVRAFMLVKEPTEETKEEAKEKEDVEDKPETSDHEHEGEQQEEIPTPPAPKEKSWMKGFLLKSKLGFSKKKKDG